MIDAVGEACGSPVVAHAAVAGGDINSALRAELADGRVAFVKHRRDPPEGFYAAEAAGLRWIGEGPLRVPEVIAVSADFLALEWIERGRGDGSLRHDELGRGLAELHALGAERFGAERLFIGPLELGGTGEDWPAVYGAMLERLARQAGAPRVARVIDRLDELCGPPEPPARLHGDLWSGNVMTGPGGTPWLIDPAAYGGHREVDLAMLRLFGAPGEEFFAAYEEVAPLADGHEDRVALYQLLPLLVHSVLFGGHYAAAADRVISQYA